MSRRLLAVAITITLACASARGGSFFNDFTSPTQTGFTLTGNAAIADGHLAVTDPVGSQQGTIVIDRLDPAGARVKSFVASWQMRLGGGTSDPADGFSFYFGTDVNTGSNFGEEGPDPAAGITVCFDTYDNGGGEAPAIDIKLDGVTVAHKNVNVFDLISAGTGANFSPLVIELKENGALTVTYQGITQYADFLIPGYAPIMNGQFAIGARTGGAWAAHWVDDLSINTEVLGAGQAPSILTQPQSQTIDELDSVTFTVLPGGTAPFTYQWYRNNVAEPGATEPTLTLTDVLFTDNGDAFKVRVTNAQGFRESDAAVLTVVRDVTAPTVVKAISNAAGDAVDVTFSERVTGGTFVIAGLAVNNVIDLAPGIVRLETAQQTAGTTYTLTINGVRDLAATPNTLAANTQVQFSAWVLVEGFVKFEFWGDIPGTTTDALFADPRYWDDNPDWVSFLSAFDSEQILPDDSVENFGARITGYFTAPQTGNVMFYTRSDDSSELGVALDPNDPEAVTELLALEPGCCNAFLEFPAIQTTEAIPVEAGQKYKLVFIYKEGTGGDYGQVAFKYEGDPTPAGSLTPIAGQYLSTWANPDEGSIVFNQHPAGAATFENSTVTFTVDVTAAPAPVVYQWQRAAPGTDTYVDIAGANGLNYTTPVLKVATDNGAKYRVKVSVPGKSATSDPALLTVAADTVAPAVVNAVAGFNRRSVTVAFSEEVAAAGAQAIGNYTIPGLTVQAAQKINANTVLLTTTMQADDTDYTVTVQNVVDTAAIPNVVNPAANSATFTSFIEMAGVMRWEAFTGLSTTGVLISEMVNSPNFPNNPSEVRILPGFEGPNAYAEGYGARIIGFITPQTTGSYVFFIATDDNGELWLSSDDTPQNVALIATEPVYGDPRGWTGVGGGGRPGCPGDCENISNPIPLQAGQRYYVELRYKEGGGGDHGAVAWKLQNQADPANGSLPIWGPVLSTAVTAEMLAAITLPQELASPIGSGHAEAPGFNARIYQVNQIGTTVTVNEITRAEQELAGCIDPNVANLAGAVNGVFQIGTVINWNQDAGPIGSFGPDDPIPGIPGLGSTPDRTTDNIAGEVIAYVEFPAAGLYTLGVNSDDGFNVTATDQPPMHNKSVRVIDGTAAGCYYAVEAAISPVIDQPIIGEIVLADPAHACADLVNAQALAGKIALLDRGVCAFTDKVTRAMNAGAIAAIVANSRDVTSGEGKWPIYMGGVYVDFPSVMISMQDGAKIKAALAAGETVMGDIWPDDTPSLGQFNAGGAVETLFVVYAPAPGVYPLRLVWFEGEGGANLEWFSMSASGEKILLNNRANAQALKTYRSRDFTPAVVNIEITSIARDGDNVVITWAADGPGPFVVQTRASLTAGDWADASGPIAGNTATLPAAAIAEFIRVVK